MPAVFVAAALALLLLAASVYDIQTRRIPNALCAAGLAAGLAGHAWQGGGPGLLHALAGIAAALPLLLLYAVRAFGAGDVKLLMAVGALMGPVFLGWTLAGAIGAGAALACASILGKSVMGRSVRTRSLPTPKSRMPFAPAIALGAVFALVHLHLPW